MPGANNTLEMLKLRESSKLRFNHGQNLGLINKSKDNIDHFHTNKLFYNVVIVSMRNTDT